MRETTCPHCQAPLALGQGQSGAFTCPNCKSQIVVPAAASLFTLLDWTRRLRLVAWLICGVGTLVVLSHYASVRTASAVQEGGAAADAGVWVVGLYVVARCVDAVTRHFDRPA